MKQKAFYFFSFFIVSFFIFLFILPKGLSIVHENDVHFTWLNPLIYEDLYPTDVHVDDTLNLTFYNNTDYFEHVYPFNASYHDDDCYLNNSYLGVETYFPYPMVHYDDCFIIFERNTERAIFVCNEQFEILYYVDNPIESYDVYVIAACTDNEYIYVKGTSAANFYKIFVLNHELLLVDIIELENVGCNDLDSIVYYDDFFYITCLNDTANTILKYDLEGTFIDSVDVSIYIQGIAIIGYYECIMYLYDVYDDDIHLFDVNFNYLTTYYRAFYPAFVLMHLCIYGNIVYTTTTSYEKGIYLLNMTFEEELYYDHVSYFPNQYGLFDGVDNLNVSFIQQANKLDNEYGGVYSFVNDVIGSVPNEWINESTGTSNAQVVEEIDGHRYCLNLTDISGSYLFKCYNVMGNEESGTIEFWIRTTDATKLTYFQVKYSTTTLIQLYISADKFGYEDGGGGHIITTCLDDVWYHIRIDFECGSGLYEGLSEDTFNILIDNVSYGSYDFLNVGNTANILNFQSSNPTAFFYSFIDAVGYSWNETYNIGDNYVNFNYSFYNEFIFYNETHYNLLNITCFDGNYYVNGVDIDYNIFYDNGTFIEDFWNVVIDINQLSEIAIISFYNQTHLLYSNIFNTCSLGNIKYIKHIHYYTIYEHYLNIYNFSIYSNDTMISGLNGFISYELDLEMWNFQVSTTLNISGNGIYKFYVSNNTYENQSSVFYQISNWVIMRNETVLIEVPNLECIILYPYLIVETMNGLYLFDSISIGNVATNVILYDERGYTYEGVFTHLNVNTTNSFFYVENDKLYFEIIFNDDNLEYIQMSFDIQNIVNENYMLLYSSYLNTYNDYLIVQMVIKHVDVYEMRIDIDYLYDTETVILQQDRISSLISFYISDNDMLNNENKTIYGYIEDFIFHYSETVSIDIFFENMLSMLIPLIIIISLTMSISYALRDDTRDGEMFNKRIFFPLFVLSSVIVFIAGFYNAWILFVIMVVVIVYLIKKRGEFS